MPNRNYEKGRRYEYHERDLWRERDYYSERQYGSYGAFDVYAISGDGKEVVFVSVKSFAKRRGSYREALAALRKLPSGPAIRRLLVIYGPIKPGVATPRKEIPV